MKALARIILHQLLFAVWLLAMCVLYCTPACMHPIEHLIAVPFAVLIPAAVIMRPAFAGARDRMRAPWIGDRTPANGCVVRPHAPARHQFKGGKRCQAKHQADRKARSGSNGRSHPPASA